MAKPPAIKHTDSNGRLTLGKAFANKAFLIEEREHDIVLRPARVLPESETWLYENPAALASLRRGLEQARSGKLVADPRSRRSVQAR